MSEINDQSSDTSSNSSWPLDGSIEGQQHDRVVFENVPDQYVKGEDVTAFLTILHDIKVDANADQIGLLRVGCINIKECLAYAAVQFNPSTTSGSVRHGTATFPSSSLPVNDEEFYQFCYILQKSKILGTSVPFQLNCTLDDIDLLTNTPVRKTKSGGLIALADNDNDDLVVIHTKQMLTEEKLRQENRHLFEVNRRLELQKDECQVKLDTYELKRKDQLNKLNNELQLLKTTGKTATDELASRQQSETKLRTEYDACRSLCNQYQSEATQYIDRCRTLEEAQTKILQDANQIRTQLAVTSQLTKDQATQIIDLERRLMQSDQLSKTANQRQSLLEQQIRDLRLTSEKHQLSMHGQLEAHAQQIVQREDQIKALESKHNLLNEELKTVKDDNECLTVMSTREKELREELQEQINELQEEHRRENELLRNELDKQNTNSQYFMTLKSSYTEIEKRCVKHQKTELEVKRQLTVYQTFVADLQREIQDLTERLSAGAEEYKILFRKYTALEQSTENHPTEIKPTADDSGMNDDDLFAVLTNTHENQHSRISSNKSSIVDINVEERQCPMCFWQFPDHMTMDGKREHIEHHFN